MKKNNRKKGFTIVELMIIVTIVAILAAVAIPNFLSSRDKEKDESAKNALRAVKAALDMYSTEKGLYPPNQIYPDDFKKALGEDYWPRNISLGKESGNISDVLTNSKGTKFTLVAVGRDITHCWQITESGEIAERNTPDL